jgi:hypothetical protein
LYRHLVLSPKRNPHIRWTEIGRYWSFEPEGAFAYFAHWDDHPETKTVHIVARAALYDVDWSDTLFWALRDPKLREIRLHVGTVVDILKVEWRYGSAKGQATKQNPWRRVTDHPETAQVLPL